MGLVRENIYLYDVQVPICLVDAHEDYNCFGEVSFFVTSNISKCNRAVIMFCVKLKNTTTEMFEMLTSSYSEECLSRTSVFELHKSSKKLRK
jgi:hypothetical protein